MFATFATATRTALIAVTALLPASIGHAATFAGTFWDANNSFNSIDAVYSYIAQTDADGTFLSTAIDYPTKGETVGSSTRVVDFLGAIDGATYVGKAGSTMTTSVFQFTGALAINGLQTIKVGSDDGFALKLNGVEVLSHSAPRAFAYTAGTFEFSDVTIFELTYYENYGNTGVRFLIGDTVVNGSMAATVQPPAVPLPAALPLLGAGLIALGSLRRKRRA